MKELTSKSKCLGMGLFVGALTGWVLAFIPLLLGSSNEAMVRFMVFGFGFATGYYYLKFEQIPIHEDDEEEPGANITKSTIASPRPFHGAFFFGPHVNREVHVWVKVGCVS